MISKKLIVGFLVLFSSFQSMHAACFPGEGSGEFFPEDYCRYRELSKIPVKQLEGGFSMPVLGFGTGTITKDRKDLLPLFDHAIALGVTHIDTAENYYNEELLAEVIKKHDRSKLFITSKVSGCNMSYEGIIAACENSLKQLGTPYLDLYLLHEHPSNNKFNIDNVMRANKKFNIDDAKRALDELVVQGKDRFNINDAMRALDTLVKQGKVRNIGVSNFLVGELEEAQKLTQNKIVCNQVWYSLKERAMEELYGMVKYCNENDVFLVAYRPLLPLYFNQKGLACFDKKIPKIIEYMCEKYHKTPNQIALNWLMSQKNIITIPQTTSFEHFEENLGSLGWKMEDEDIELLRTEYPGQTIQGYLTQGAEEE